MIIETIFPNAAQIDTQNAILARIASKMGAYDEDLSWGAIQNMVRGGGIGSVLQPGDQVEVALTGMVTASVDGTGISSASVVKDTFIAAAGTGKTDYVFTYDGANWLYDGEAVTLSNYGITANGTPVEDDTITIHRTATTYDFDVDGIDEMQTVNESLAHNLAILMHDIYSTINFDPSQYLFAVTAESLAALGISGSVLPAATYNVTLNHGSYGGGTGEDGTYQFTTTQAIPIGGGIRHTWMGDYSTNSADYNSNAKMLAGKFITYGANTYTELEQVSTVSGSSGTNLGTATARDPQYKSGNYINFTDRQIYGSNRWSTSWLRQLLNSEDAVLAWTPGTIWSRNLNIQPEGFLHAIGPELRAVLAKTRTRYAKSISDGYGYEDIEDYVTLATMLDVYGSNNNNIAEGPVTAAGVVTRTTYTSLWKNAAQADKIKYQSGTARTWWLASTHPPVGSSERIVNTTGAGDAMTAGLAKAYFLGLSPEDTARCALAAASLAVETEASVNPAVSHEMIMERMPLVSDIQHL